jgi:transposase
MTHAERFVGIDVSKARLDACLWPEGEERAFANDRQGLRDLVRWLRRLQPQAIGFEASGGYERALLAALCEAQLPARRVNPARLRQFARAAGALAKNDRIDAVMIARFCAALPQREARHDPVLAALPNWSPRGASSVRNAPAVPTKRNRPVRPCSNASHRPVSSASRPRSP